MPHPTLLSSGLRRATVAVSLFTSALFAGFAGVLAVAAAGVGAPAATGVAAVLGTLLYLPLLWLHCHVAGYVSYSPGEFGGRRTVEGRVGRVGSCVVCGATDERGVRRAYAEQLVVAGIPLTTRESGENAYCSDCHAVEHGDGGTDEAADRVVEAEVEVDRD